MLAPSQLLTIYIILALHILVITALKARTTMIITITISNLVTILFFNITISDPQILKELVIVIIIYSATILTLISNSNHIYIIDSQNSRFQKRVKSAPVIAVVTLVIAVGVFYLVKNIDQTSKAVHEKQLATQKEISRNPVIFPGHLVHKNVKKYYFGKNQPTQIFSGKSQKMDDIHNQYYKKILRSKPIFDRLSEAILIIISGMIILLFHYQYKSKKS